MSVVQLSPHQSTHDQLAFLPHAPPPLVSRTPPSHKPVALPRVRSNTNISPGSNGSKSPKFASRSAPASPSGRLSLPAGLAPLSVISPITLDNTSLPNHNQGNPYSPRGHHQSLTMTASYFPSHSMPNISTTSNPSKSPKMQAFPISHNVHIQQSQPQPQPKYHPQPSQPLRHLPQHTHSTPNAIAGPSRQPFPPNNNISLQQNVRKPSHGRSSRSRSRPRTDSSSEGTETEVDSDSTFVPGRIRKHSQSQPNLVVLRNRLEGWAGDVASSQLEDRRMKPIQPQQVPGIHRRKTPPNLPIPLVQSHTSQSHFPSSSGNFRPPSRSPKSSSHGSLLDLRNSPSPRSSMINIHTMTPFQITTTYSSNTSIDSNGDARPTGMINSSEDADGEFDGTESISSGSLTFSPKARKTGLRQRMLSDRAKVLNGNGGLGLTFDQENSLNGGRTSPRGSLVDLTGITPEGSRSGNGLFMLRLLAIFPAVWGALVLFQAVVTGGLWYDVYPWGVDTSREALDRLIMGGTYEGTWGRVDRGDMVLCIAWAALTGQFCFDLTTGLTHRWRIYYDLPATITRLLSIQCICQPLTGLTLWILGPHRVLFAWVVIGISTAWSRCIQMYVTSNIVNHGDITPGATKRRSLTPKGSRVSLSLDGELQLERDREQSSQQQKKGGRGLWEEFTMDRVWDWDAIAREVGWKVGILLLVTNAWLFWGIEVGRWSGIQTM